LILALLIEVAEICGCEVFALGKIGLLLLSFCANALDGPLDVLMDPWVAGIWALNYMDSVLKE
jgi:hypothetical protein